MQKRNLILLVVAALFVVYSACTMTVVKKGEEAKLTGEVVFSPQEAAQNFWQEHGDTYFAEKAIEITKLLEEANGDFSKVEKYAFKSGDSTELNFIVKGEAEVTKIKTNLRAGYLGLKIAGVEKPSDIRLQVGPVFKGAAVRDSINLISYKDYKNQIEWAQVSVGLHNLILDKVLKPIDLNSLEGKKIEFIGCFSVSRPSQLLITPVSLKVMD